MDTTTLTDHAFKKQWCMAVWGPLSETRSLHTKPLFYSHWFKLCSCRVSCWDSHFQALHCWCDTAASSPLTWGSPWLRTASGKSNGFPGPQCPSQQSLWARASKSPQHSGGSQVRDWNPPPGTHSVSFSCDERAHLEENSFIYVAC